MKTANATESWRQLAVHQPWFTSSGTTITALFKQQPDRSESLTLRCGGLHADFSRNFINSETLALFQALADDCGLKQHVQDLFDGKQVNNTEHRAALHTALRGSSAADLPEATALVRQTLAQMSEFVSAIHDGQWRGYSGAAISDVVNIGIGGSDLGPAMVTDALRNFHKPGIRCHFVSNVDPAHMEAVLSSLDQATTLFVVASKSFRTLETLHNAQLARQWFLSAANHQGKRLETEVHRHFVAVTANVEAARTFGILANNIFPMWDWVGGRFSLWSAIGLPIALATSMHNFRQLLAGAHLMDEQFRSQPLASNIPMMLGLLAVWYRNFWNAASHAVLPYAQDLHLLPAYLQQLEMESLGKSTDRHGNPLSAASGPVIWGSAGTNGQHSFHQLLHQGTQFIPADFIAVAKPICDNHIEQHQHLLANCFSQSLALMSGKNRQEALDELLAQGMDKSEAELLCAHRQVPGNRPNTMLILQQLDPHTLGSLLAMYEHKVFVQSVIWRINAFDQWGVEIGKQLSGPMFNALAGDASALASLDSSSQHWINLCHHLSGNPKAQP